MKSLTQRDVVAGLSERGIVISVRTYQNWEGGATQPKYSQLVALRDVLGIRLNGQEEDHEAHEKCAPRRRGRGAA